MTSACLHFISKFNSIYSIWCSNRAGFDGEECLFKAICEAAEQPFGDHNGVLGDIVHIIFR